MLCCWIICLAIEPAAVRVWISAATDVCGVKIAGVGWWSAGGGDTGREGEGGRDGSSSLRMHNGGGRREADEQRWK